MPANIATDSKTGKAMAAYAIRPAWHGFGTVLDHYMTAREIVKAAHLGWGVVKAPAYAKVGGRFVEAPGNVALVREDTHTVFGFATPDYQVHSNLDPMLVMEAITRTKQAGFSSAFAIGNGAKVGCTLDLTALGDFKIPGDPSKHKAHLVGTWAFDGTEAIRFAEWNTRIECANMRAAFIAGTNNAANVVRIRHTGDLRDKLEEARKILGYAEQAREAHVKLMTALGQQPAPLLNTAKGAAWWDTFLDNLGFKIEEGMVRPGIRQEARDTIVQLFRDSRTLDGVKMSGYRILQAVDEYADHFKPLRCTDPKAAPERAFRSIMDGGAASELKSKALDLLCAEFKIDAKALVAAGN